jgi:NAD-dependent dihydropyrimidine dehydrogenase PreA subunit
MDMNDKVYIKLQRHLDSQPIGFPATKSGAEIRILKHIFSPREAEIATCLSYKFETLETIFKKTGHLAVSFAELEEQLDVIKGKGGIESKIKDGKKFYCNAPLVVGMYEYQVGKLTPEFIKDFDEYTSDRKWGVDFLSTKLPQMRTIPIARSIQPQNNVSTFDEVAVLLKQSEGPYAILECICRQKRALTGEPCQVTDRKETCLAIGNMSQTAIEKGYGREITMDEAISILEQNQKQGLVLQPSNTEKAEFICSCCGCCCGMLRMMNHLPKPLDFWASNFYAVVDIDACNGCGNCEKRCQVGAAKVSGKNRLSSIDLTRCIGCGLCVPSCPENAITLHKKPDEVIPPATKENLHDIIMSNKKGALGKLKLIGKLLVDTVTTGRINLFR